MARNGVRVADTPAMHPALKYRAIIEKSLTRLGNKQVPLEITYIRLMFVRVIHQTCCRMFMNRLTRYWAKKMPVDRTGIFYLLCNVNET